jgi:hypothetical protein
MKRHPHPFCAKAAARLLAIVLPLGAVCGQDSLEVTFVGDRELEVRDVVKPASTPTRVDLGMAKPTIDYAPIAKSIAPVTQVRPIEPFAVRMDAPLPRLYAGYAKGGFGLYTSPFADIHYGETQSRKGSWGFNLVHRSSAGSTGQVDSLGLDEGWSHNVLQGHYKRFIDRSSLTLEGGIQRDAWGIHGLDLSMIDPTTFAAPDGRQTYSRVYTSARLQNHQRDSTKVQRDLRLTTSRLTLGLSPVPSNAAMPEIFLSPGRENLVTATGAFQTWRDDALFSLDLEGHFIGSQIDAQGGVDGGMQRNALHDLVQENPWFDARYNAGADALRGTLQNTNRALEVYGGLRGKFTRDLAFNAQARTVTYRDFGYWVNEPGVDSTGQRFSLAFDTLTVASVIGEAAYRGQGPLELEARAEFHTYGTGNQPYAWYQPRTRISGSARWNLDELLFLEAGMDIVGARYAPSRTPFAAVAGDGEDVQTSGELLTDLVFGGTDPIYARKLPAYTALDIGVEYRYNARLALGLDASGPLGKTQIFNGYNAQRFQVMMWAGYRF